MAVDVLIEESILRLTAVTMLADVVPALKAEGDLLRDIRGTWLINSVERLNDFTINR